ncbi:MAG: hypothetical protein FP823_18615 [Rhodoferax sp.]|nr:hypothetical protein [Rhodoferax sp.]
MAPQACNQPVLVEDASLNGFARARCDDCGHAFLVALCCPSCNARRMAETPVHLCEHVCPHLSVFRYRLVQQTCGTAVSRPSTACPLAHQNWSTTRFS